MRFLKALKQIWQRLPIDPKADDIVDSLVAQRQAKIKTRPMQVQTKELYEL